MVWITNCFSSASGRQPEMDPIAQQILLRFSKDHSVLSIYGIRRGLILFKSIDCVQESDVMNSDKIPPILLVGKRRFRG
jgi:hypothetical protein